MKHRVLIAVSLVALVVLVIHRGRQSRVEHLTVRPPSCSLTIDRAMVDIKRDCGSKSSLPPIPPQLPPMTPPNTPGGDNYIGKNVRQVQDMLRRSHPTYTVRLIKQGQPVTMDIRPDRIDVVYIDLPIPPNVMSQPYTYTRVVKVTFPTQYTQPQLPPAVINPPATGDGFTGQPVDKVVATLKQKYPGKSVTAVRDGLQNMMRFTDSTIVVLWKWGFLDDTYTRIVSTVMNLPSDTTTSPPSSSPAPRVTTNPPLQRANIPSWIYNFSSQVAVNYLRVLNPGFTIRRARTTDMMTQEWNPKRLTVLYNTQDKIVDIKQG